MTVPLLIGLLFLVVAFLSITPVEDPITYLSISPVERWPTKEMVV